MEWIASNKIKKTEAGNLKLDVLIAVQCIKESCYSISKDVNIKYYNFVNAALVMRWTKVCISFRTMHQFKKVNQNRRQKIFINPLKNDCSKFYGTIWKYW